MSERGEEWQEGRDSSRSECSRADGGPGSQAGRSLLWVPACAGTRLRRGAPEPPLQARLEIRLVEAELLGLVDRVRAQAHGAILADDLAVGALVEILELEQLLGDDHRAFH